MTREVLGIIWFALVGVLLGGYAVFDGFDLGAAAFVACDPAAWRYVEDDGSGRQSQPEHRSPRAWTRGSASTPCSASSVCSRAIRSSD